MKIHRRLVLGGMASLLTVPFVPSASPAGAAEKIKIGFLLKTMQEERYQRDKKAFTDKANALGAQVIFDSANNDEQTQLAAFENMLSAGAQVIVMQPVNTGTAGSMVTSAHKNGVKVVGYDSMLVNGPLDAMVMQDSWAVGKLQARGNGRLAQGQKRRGQRRCRADKGPARRLERQRHEQRRSRCSSRPTRTSSWSPINHTKDGRPTKQWRRRKTC